SVSSDLSCFHLLQACKSPHDRSPGKLDLECIVTVWGCTRQSGLRSGPVRLCACGCPSQDVLATARPPWYCRHPAEADASIADHPMLHLQDDSRRGKGELIGGAIADLEVAGTRALREERHL